MEYEPPLAVSECPETLREREQWVCWREETRDGKPTKVPVTPGTGGFASSTDPETWDAFETALEYTETEHADGVGFVFTDDDPIVGVDLTTAAILKRATSTTPHKTSSSDSTPIRRYRRPVPAITS